MFLNVNKSPVCTFLIVKNPVCLSLTFHKSLSRGFNYWKIRSMTFENIMFSCLHPLTKNPGYIFLSYENLPSSLHGFQKTRSRVSHSWKSCSSFRLLKKTVGIIPSLKNLVPVLTFENPVQASLNLEKYSICIFLTFWKIQFIHFGIWKIVSHLSLIFENSVQLYLTRKPVSVSLTLKNSICMSLTS